MSIAHQSVDDQAGTSESHEGGSPDLTPLEFVVAKTSPKAYKITARHGSTGELIHLDTFDVNRASSRRKFVKDVALRAKVSETFVDSTLTGIVSELIGTEANERHSDHSAAVEYQVVDDPADAGRNGIYRLGTPVPEQITNFAVAIEREVKVHDDLGSESRFEGTIRLSGQPFAFSISSHDYSDNRKLQAVIYGAAGSKARFPGDARYLKDAISAVSKPVRVERTSNFGWTPDGATFLAASGYVDAKGFHDYGEGDLRVDLQREESASWLDLSGLPKNKLKNTRKHIVEDFLAHHDRSVTFSLLGAAALAPLLRHVEGVNRFALWLKGPSGEGKSFAAKLAQNYFGDFPVQDGKRVGNWTSTANALQRQGYFFKDALYLIDDYKPESVKQGDVVKLVQNYADGSARGRLNADSTSKVTREIRGFMLATGEDVPEHSSSALARTIVIDLPPRERDLERGAKCIARRKYYRGVMADFIRWSIAEGRAAHFVARYTELQQFYYKDIVGQPNDLRIATNFALLAAAFTEIATYLQADWPGWEDESRTYVEEDLVRIRDAMLGNVREQRPGEIFMATLQSLLAHQRVRITGLRGDKSGNAPERVPSIGKAVVYRGRTPMSNDTLCEISIPLALEVVQDSLRKQGKPELRVSAQTLIGELSASGKLLDLDGKPIKAGGQASGTRGGGKKTGRKPSSHLTRINGRQLRCFWILLRDLTGSETRP